MFVIVNSNNQVFTRITSNTMLGSESWADKIDLDRMAPIQVTIFPDESTATTTIHNILAFRDTLNPNRKETLKVIPFHEYFKG
jgi:hypothetical protein